MAAFFDNFGKPARTQAENTKKTELTNENGVWHLICAMAKSIARIDSRNQHKAQQRQIRTALFYYRAFRVAGCMREPSGSPVSLWAGLSTVCSPPFFCLAAEKGGSSNNSTQGKPP